ncbi:MAG TPA: signal peptidase I [Candidatus Paceibacterota bacterium]|nr:signal peptidase I [Candidatus Paceibacterota bacterium]
MPQENRDNFFTELLKFALIAIIIVVPLRIFVAKPFIVSGASMEPTFDTGQYLIVDELSYRLEAPQRLDVVIFKYPRDTSQYFIKRIIGLPGETVIISGGQVSIKTADGKTVALSEPYIKNLGNGGDMQVTLKTDEYFVMGDNRPESSDSRIWGVLPRADIVGRAFLRLLPVSTLGVFPGSATAQQ